jgi:F-type H+-transporting ATPase subunit delta
MSEITTAARPYARAAFEVAKEKGTLQVWSDQLAFMAAVANDPQMRAVLDSPALTRSQRADLMISVCGDHIDDQAKNLVKLLAENGRLAVLPEIAALYEVMRAEAEGSVDAEVISAQDVSDAQLAKIAEALKGRLGREVKLTTRIDDSLIGGAIVRAGDLVIDGSIRGRLAKLAAALSR